MKIILITFIVILISLTHITSQVDSIITDEEKKLAGITPDSFWYKFDLGWDKVTEFVDANNKVKHVKERLAEAKVMIEENKVTKAQVALNEFNKIYDQIEFKEKVSNEKELVDNLGQRISAIASQKGRLNETQIKEIRELIILNRGGEIIVSNITKRTNQTLIPVTYRSSGGGGGGSATYASTGCPAGSEEDSFTLEYDSSTGTKIYCTSNSKTELKCQQAIDSGRGIKFACKEDIYGNDALNCLPSGIEQSICEYFNYVGGFDIEISKN